MNQPTRTGVANLPLHYGKAPRWLFERGRVLKDMGRRADAQRLFRQVVEGKWAPGLQNYADQAKKELEK